MKHSQRDVWIFLKKNAVLNIRRYGEYFQFLINTDHFETDAQISQIEEPIIFFTLLRRQLTKLRPADKVFLGFPDSSNTSHWNRDLIYVDHSSPSGAVYGYKSKRIMNADVKIIRRLMEIKQYEADTYELLNLVMFRKAKVPATLAVGDNPAMTGGYTEGPKHIIVREGVDRLLEIMRTENPTATLDEAKHFYATQTDDTYGNVNKLYHYKRK